MSLKLDENLPTSVAPRLAALGFDVDTVLDENLGGRSDEKKKEPEQKEWANAIKVLFPNAKDRGTHVNVSGVAMAKYAPNKDNAQKLIDFLASGEAQEIYAAQVFEYPVMPGKEPADIVKSFGTIKPATLPLADIAANRKKASELVDKVGYNDGPEM